MAVEEAIDATVCAPPLESASMQAEPRRHTLIEDELDILMTREAQRHHEGLAEMPFFTNIRP